VSRTADARGGRPSGAAGADGRNTRPQRRGKGALIKGEPGHPAPGGGSREPVRASHRLASATYLFTRRFHRVICASMAVGGLSALLGIYLSYYLNLASGAAIILVATALFFVTLALMGRVHKPSDRGATN
jgi:hypothetical protein